jgi:hypothetical protein
MKGQRAADCATEDEASIASQTATARLSGVNGF